MAFKKGEPRPANAGRKKGSKNLVTMPSLRQSLAAQGFDLGAQLLQLLSHPNTDPNTKLKILQLIAQFTQVVPKEEEKSTPDDSLPDNPDDLLNLLKSNDNQTN